MKKYRIRGMISILLVVAVTVLGLTGCVANVQSPNTNISSGQLGNETHSSSASDIQLASDSADLTGADTQTSWEEAASTYVDLNDAAISVSGSGAVATGGILTITTGGTYIINGTLTDGQILIDATKNDMVHLVLNGVNITNRTGAPIYGSQCEKLIVTLAQGTTNTLTDAGASFNYENAADEEPNAALFCKDDLTINGGGTLNINAGFNNGITTKDNLLIVGGELVIRAANHGLRGNDSVAIIDGSFQITAGNDGIQTDNVEDTTKGWISIENGTFLINSAHDSIQADTALTISDGNFVITAGGGVDKISDITTSETTSDSFKGLKATGNIVITNGTFVIDSYDDSIHANGTINIHGGAFTLSTGDDGIHADERLTVSGGGITVTTSYEGLEAADIIIADGIVDIQSSDDGINAAGGSDQDTVSDQFSKDNFTAKGSYSINISGGQITINARGDGIDSNGDLNISGGIITSVINSTPDNGGMDVDGRLTIADATVIYGGSGIGSNPDGNSAQSYVYIGSGVSSGKEITIRKNGEILITYMPSIDCQYLILSSPDIISGQSYEAYSGESLISDITAGTGGSSMGGPGMGGGHRGQGDPGGKKPMDGNSSLLIQ